MDELDRSIVIELQRNARKSDAQIARALNVSGASVRRRIRKMVDERVLRVVAVANPRKVGYESSAMIGIQVQPAKTDEVASRLAVEPRVHTLTLSTGPFDLLIWVTFTSDAELSNFMKKFLYTMPGVVRTETMFFLREIKRNQNILEDPERPLTYRDEIAGRRGGALSDHEADDKPAEIDDCDRKLIMELQQDARQSDTELARKLEISDATVRRRMARLVDERIIDISPVPISIGTLGYPITVNFGLQMDLSKVDHALDILYLMPRVHYIALTTGRYDIWLWSTFRSPRDLSSFLRFELAKVPGMIRSETLVNLELKKKETAVLTLLPGVSQKADPLNNGFFRRNATQRTPLSVDSV